jgi:hypothetical protein
LIFRHMAKRESKLNLVMHACNPSPQETDKVGS